MTMIKMPRGRSVRGFATGTALTAVLACFLILGGLMYSASAQFGLSNRSLRKTQATLVAEAGIEHAMDALSNNWNATTGNGTLYEDPGTNTVSAGTFSYTISSISTSRRLITVTATSFNGISTTVVGVAEYISNDSISLSRYALLSDQTIGFGGNSTIKTDPLNGHNADARANGSITQGGSSSVDGTLMASGSVAGNGYYANQAGVDPVAFPTADQLTDWEALWRTQSLSAGRSYTPSTAPASITAPAYINGDVSLTGKKTLTITGSGVVFIDGSLTMNAQTVVTNSATLIVKNQFNCNGQSYYNIPAASLVPATGFFTGTLVSLYGDMQLNGGGDATGIVYCARGNMKVNGGAIYKGALIASGNIDTIGTYDHIYSGNMKSSISFPIPLRLVKIVEP